MHLKNVFFKRLNETVKFTQISPFVPHCEKNCKFELIVPVDKFIHYS